MSKCRSCGAEIIWIKTPSGKNMPCDAKPISFRLDTHNGDLLLVTPDGKVARGSFDPAAEKIGYTSHFATCPNASQHRRSAMFTGSFSERERASK